MFGIERKNTNSSGTDNTNHYVVKWYCLGLFNNKKINEKQGWLVKQSMTRTSNLNILLIEFVLINIFSACKSTTYTC